MSDDKKEDIEVVLEAVAEKSQSTKKGKKETPPQQTKQQKLQH